MRLIRFALPVLMLLSQSNVSSSWGGTIGLAAHVNGKVITTSEVQEAVEAQRSMIMVTVTNPEERIAKLRELEDQALFALLERELILSEFAKMGGSIRKEYVEDNINDIIRENFGGDRDKFVAELAKQNMTPKKFRELREKMIIVQVMRQRQVKDLPPPTPREVQEYYDKNLDKFRDKDFIRISTITIPKYPVADLNSNPESQRKLAQEIRAKLVNGADFAQLAKLHSQDSHGSDGGAWDWIERNQMGKQVADAAFPLKTGAISPVTEVDANYMIILCDAKRPGIQSPLEKVRPDIEKSIQSEKSHNILSSWARSLALKAAIGPEEVRSRFLTYLAKEPGLNQVPANKVQTAQQ